MAAARKPRLQQRTVRRQRKERKADRYCEQAEQEHLLASGRRHAPALGDRQRQEHRPAHHHAEMDRQRQAAAGKARQRVGVGVAEQQDALEEHHRHRPDRGRAAEARQHDLGEHRLHGKQQCRAEEDRRGIDGDDPVSWRGAVASGASFGFSYSLRCRSLRFDQRGDLCKLAKRKTNCNGEAQGCGSVHSGCIQLPARCACSGLRGTRPTRVALQGGGAVPRAVAVDRRERLAAMPSAGKFQTYLTNSQSNLFRTARRHVRPSPCRRTSQPCGRCAQGTQGASDSNRMIRSARGRRRSSGRAVVAIDDPVARAQAHRATAAGRPPSAPAPSPAPSTADRDARPAGR